ncbi:MAG: SAM-dependent methyltransferase [Chloroflexi bacterium]|nr:SAM-dependent methyltransferase [Chloroflexota bacterium]
MGKTKPHPASFRDPSGFLFVRDGRLFRQVNRRYAKDYEHLLESGLYDDLVGEGLLVAHAEREDSAADPESAFKVIEPETIPFVSYPYEWCFSYWKDAALVTLAIQRKAIDHGMSLKDASAYNVQFHSGLPLWIDTLSFEILRQGEPWIAYRQFCRHFLAPLALMSYVNIELGKLMRTHIDGIPLELASQLLPRRTQLKLSLLVHIHWHASAQRRFAGTSTRRPRKGRQMNLNALRGLVDNLESAIRKLNWEPGQSGWADYEQTHAYSKFAWGEKRRLTEEFLDEVRPDSVWDLGANVGSFSRLASERGIQTVAFDLDPGAVELNYLRVRDEGETHLLPLVMDLTNPSPALGWDHRERASLEQRGPTRAIFALALEHHLAISNNVPLEKLARFLARLGDSLLIEFIPKEDPQVQRLLVNREDIFTEYHREGFEAAFGSHFDILRSDPVGDSGRLLYRMVTLA